MTTRRNFLGVLSALIAMPVIGEVVPAVPVKGRGLTSSIFHVDELAYFPVVHGTSGQILVSQGNGKDPIWVDPSQYVLAEPNPAREGSMVLMDNLFHVYRGGEWVKL